MLFNLFKDLLNVGTGKIDLVFYSTDGIDSLYGKFYLRLLRFIAV